MWPLRYYILSTVLSAGFTTLAGKVAQDFVKSFFLHQQGDDRPIDMMIEAARTSDIHKLFFKRNIAILP